LGCAVDLFVFVNDRRPLGAEERLGVGLGVSFAVNGIAEVCFYFRRRGAAEHVEVEVRLFLAFDLSVPDLSGDQGLPCFLLQRDSFTLFRLHPRYRPAPFSFLPRDCCALFCLPPRDRLAPFFFLQRYRFLPFFLPPRQELLPRLITPRAPAGC